MDKKDFKVLEKIFLNEDLAPNSKNFLEVEVRLRDAKKRYEKSYFATQRNEKFELLYKIFRPLSVLEKEEAKLLTDKVILLSVAFKDIDDILAIGIYEAQKKGQMQILKDALHTYSRFNYGYSLLVHGYDLFKGVLYALADCDLNLVKKYLPEKLCLEKHKAIQFSRIANNLIFSSIHSHSGWLKRA